MTTFLQTEAYRHNALRSNAVRHGLCAETVIEMVEDIGNQRPSSRTTTPVAQASANWARPGIPEPIFSGFTPRCCEILDSAAWAESAGANFWGTTIDGTCERKVFGKPNFV